MMVRSTLSIRPPACSTRSRACSTNSDEARAAPLRVATAGNGRRCRRRRARPASRRSPHGGRRRRRCGRRGPVVRDTDAAQPQLLARGEGVDVEADAVRAGRAAAASARRNPPRKSASQAPDRPRRSRPRARPRARPGRRRSPRRRTRRRWAREDRLEAEGLRGLHADQLVARRPSSPSAVASARRVDHRRGRGRRPMPVERREQAIDHRGRAGRGGRHRGSARARRRARAPRARCAPIACRVAPPMIGAGRARRRSRRDRPPPGPRRSPPGRASMPGWRDVRRHGRAPALPRDAADIAWAGRRRRGCRCPPRPPMRPSCCHARGLAEPKLARQRIPPYLARSHAPPRAHPDRPGPHRHRR